MKDKDENGVLPAGWVEVPLLDLLTSLESGRRPRGGVRGIPKGVPSLGGEHLTSNGGFDFTNIKYVPQEFASSMKRGHIRRGDVLIVKDGATTGKTALVSESFPFDEAVANEHLFVCRPTESALPMFLASFLRSPDGQRRVLNHFQGSAQGGINQTFATGTIMPVSPLAEQRRITEHLDIIENRRASIDGRLQAARARLDRFHSAVLSAACTGRLTKDWREQHLLGAAGQYSIGPSDANQTSHLGLTSKAQLELLPSSWSLIRLGDTLDVTTGATPLRTNSAYYDDGTIPWVTSGAVNTGTITSPTELITPRALEETNVKLFPPGTLLIAMYGEGQTRGRVAELAIEAGTNQALAAVLFTKETVPIRPYIRLFFEDSYQRLRSLSVGGVQPNLNLGMIRDTLLPLPPREEQAEIVLRTSAALGAAGRIATYLEQAVHTLDHVSASALTKAFRGELVPTEAALAAEEGRDYETAEELFARVNAKTRQ